MKLYFKKIAALLATALVAVSFTACNTLDKLSVINENERTEKESTTYLPEATTVSNPHGDLKTGYYYTKLSPAQQEGYKNMLAALDGHPEKILLPLLTQDEIGGMYQALCYDNPWLVCLKSGYSYGTNGEVCYIAPQYVCSGDECGKMTAEIQKAVDDAMAGIPDGADDYRKEVVLHDWLVNRCKNLDTGSIGKNAYDALVLCEADSYGYARAMQLLLDKAGVQNFPITGTARDLSLKEAKHMWNIVTIDGNNYHLDANLDDPVNTMKEFLYHCYFNLSDEEIAIDHFDYDKTETNCNSTEANYYPREGLLYEVYGDEVKAELKEMIREMAENHEYFIEVRFANDPAYIEGKKDMVDYNGIYKMVKELNPSLGENELSRDMLYWNYTERYNMMHFEFTYSSEMETAVNE